MTLSPYSKLVTDSINESGGDFNILKDLYADIVKKTTITYRSERKKSSIIYYDSKNYYICEAFGNPDDFPILGTLEETSKRKEYQREYDQHSCKSFHLKLTENDQDIIDFLNKEKNKQGLIKQLLRTEIERRKNER